MDSLEAHARRERLKHRANWIIAIGTLMGSIATVGLLIDAVLTEEPVIPQHIETAKASSDGSSCA